MDVSVQIELIRLVGAILAAWGVAWISSRGPKKILEKVAEVHTLTNDHATKQEEKIDKLITEVGELKNAASYKAGFEAGQEENV